IIETDKTHKNLLAEVEENNGFINTASKKIGELFKSGKQTEAEEIKKEVGKKKEANKTLNEELKTVEKELFDAQVKLPNLPHPSVPNGKSEADNEIVKTAKVKVNIPKEAVPHWELAQRYNLIDFELGNKITGAGFPVYIGKGAILQRSLIRFFLDEAAKAEYTEYIPPLMVNGDTAFGTGQLPDKEGQMYYIPTDDLYMVPTAEVPLTNIYRNSIIDENELPVRMTAYTPCFRREAGSYGKDVRGLNRVHQFDKVEIVQIQHPDKSYDTLDEMVKYVEGLLMKLGLPYRIMRLCGGDVSFTSAITYDFEVYSAAQDKWLEVSSVSNFETFQSNRLKLRIKSKDSKKKILAHTLNGSALALPRILAALLENNQTSTGIRVPGILVPYTGFDIIRQNTHKKQLTIFN
ncbi:MAG: serine--tRNA ligase, partial [Bacteroidales bacterium]|nr:serine--tRNA ligase [Bacteroidales bacterium]